MFCDTAVAKLAIAAETQIFTLACVLENYRSGVTDALTLDSAHADINCQLQMSCTFAIFAVVYYGKKCECIW